jgi:hypothetical protein
MSGLPTMPDRMAAARCSRGSPELRTTRLWCSIFSVFSSYGTGGVRGTHQGGLLPARGGGSRARRAAARFKPQTLAMVGNTPRVGSRQVGPNGCDAERRTLTSGRWCSRIVACDVTMKGVNLGFVLIFFEILAQLPPIYKGFELIISCACRDLSLSFQIRLGFDISSDFIEILVGGISVSVATRHEVGDNQH